MTEEEKAHAIAQSQLLLAEHWALVEAKWGDGSIIVGGAVKWRGGYLYFDFYSRELHNDYGLSSYEGWEGPVRQALNAIWIELLPVGDREDIEIPRLTYHELANALTKEG